MYAIDVKVMWQNHDKKMSLTGKPGASPGPAVPGRKNICINRIANDNDSD